MKILFKILELAFILIFIYGFLCVVGEAEPWTVSAQIWLFVKGMLLMLFGFLGCGFIEGKETV